MQRRTPEREALEWDDVRLFVALCHARTVSVAADTLGVDASTISRRLVRLEKSLRVTLFERSRDGITPTEAAADLLPLAEEVERAAHRFEHAADGLESDVAGLVRITSPPDFATIVLAPAVQELFRRHPALRVELNPGEAVLDLRRREADLALRTARPVHGDLIVKRLTSVPWVVAGSSELVRDLGALSDWNDAPWVTWGTSTRGVTPARWFTTHVKKREPIVRTDNLLVQLGIVATGAGIALVPEPSLAHYGLVPVKLASALRGDAQRLPTDDLYLVTHRALRNVPRVRVVWEHLLERYA